MKGFFRWLCRINLLVCVWKFFIYILLLLFFYQLRILFFPYFLFFQSNCVNYISILNVVLDPISNGSFGNIQQGLQNAELCYPLQKNMSVILTNEQVSFDIVWILMLQHNFFFTITRRHHLCLTYKVVSQISPGVWYWGLFNGIGPTRTQSKMVLFKLWFSDAHHLLCFICNTFSVSVYCVCIFLFGSPFFLTMLDPQALTLL